jgi:hypothetical protein
MLVKKLQKLPDGTYALCLSGETLQLLGIDPEQTLLLRTDGKNLHITAQEDGAAATTPTVLPDLKAAPATQGPGPAPVYTLQSEEYYWDMAAQRQERELFMNTLRPYLRAKWDYEYSELLCEREAKKLCQKYYQAKERGEEFKGPFWADC